MASWLANSILLVHFIWVLFILGMIPVTIIGAYLSWKWVYNFKIRILHIIMMAIVTIETVFGISCPLTIWENQARVASGAKAVYEKDFIAYWIHKIMFFDLPHWAFLIVYVFVLLTISFLWVAVEPRKTVKLHSNQR